MDPEYLFPITEERTNAYVAFTECPGGIIW